MANLSHSIDIFSDGSIKVTTPQPTGRYWMQPPDPATLQLPPDVWSLVNFYEAPTIKDRPWDGSFSAMGGHGQGNALQLGKTETHWLYSLYDNAILQSWSAAPGGRTYITTKDPDVLWWPIILSSSREEPYHRNLVHVLDRVDNGKRVMGQAVPAVLLEGIPKSADYSAYDPIKQPWLFSWLWTANKNASYGVTHTVGRMEYVFIMPLFNPAGGFVKKPGTWDFWVPEACLLKKLSQEHKMTD